MSYNEDVLPDAKHKLLFGSLSLLILALGILFALTFWELKNSEKESRFYYLQGEEGVVIKSADSTQATENTEQEEVILPVTPVLFQYIEVIEGCGPYFTNECLNARSGPGTSFPVIARLRNGMVLKVAGVVERDGDEWYKISFEEWLRYPERVVEDWYVSAKHVRVLMDEGVKTDRASTANPGNKRIVVSREKQMLYAYEGDELFMEEKISTGVELTPTPLGTFTIFKKTPSRYMQGPIPGVSEKYWDLPGVPWNLYFTNQGAVIHGTYWHDRFGSKSSNGCVNMAPPQAEKLYKWAEIGTKVTVVD